MKTLDDQVPSGYFEALPAQILGTLGRPEDSSMQPMGTTGSDRDGSGSTGIPPMKDRDEDSGLHDIRSLASSTKARLSSRRSTANPVMTEDDIIASSSAGWKAVALPEPAKMISLPELAELPSAKEVKAQDKAARKAKDFKRSDELREELAIDAEVGEELHRQEWSYPDGGKAAAGDGAFHVFYFMVPSWKGEPVNNVFSEIRWVKPAALLTMDILEGNRDAIVKLVAHNGNATVG